MVHHVLPSLGPIPLAELRATHVRGLQAELLGQRIVLNRAGMKIEKTRSPKSVKNVIAGSFRSMIQQAKADELLVRDIFAGLKWPEWEPPDPDPLTPTERTRILDWFKARRYGLHPGRGSMAKRSVLHPAYFGYIHLLFWTGMRPSEAAGLQWADVDLANRLVHVRRSRHLYEYVAPKTKQARRTIEIFPETVLILRSLQPQHVSPEAPVFVNVTGGPVEPKVVSPHWYSCLRELGIRMRGLYCTKDTFVTSSFRVGAKIPWLEAQTGVKYETLRKHYGKWVPREGQEELRRFEREAPELFAEDQVKLAPKIEAVGGQFPVSRGIVGGEEMRGGGLEPPRVLPH